MIEVKKIFVAIIGIIIGIAIFETIKIEEIQKLNEEIKKEISSTNIKNVISQNDKLKQDIENLKNTKKDKWEELESWEKIKEKISNALK